MWGLNCRSQTTELIYQIHNIPTVPEDLAEVPIEKKRSLGGKSCQLQWQWFLHIPQTYWITWVLIRFHCIPYSATVFWAPIFRHIRIDFQLLIALFWWHSNHHVAPGSRLGSNRLRAKPDVFCFRDGFGFCSGNRTCNGNWHVCIYYICKWCTGCNDGLP